jgi:hypothetical protein
MPVAPPAVDPAPPAAQPAAVPPPLEIGPPPSADAFPRAPGETPRAYGAFAAYFALGHARSLPDVADQLGEHLTTVKTWSARFRWSERIASFNAGLLRQAADAQLARHREHADDWARRTRECREQEWDAARKLRAAAQCFLETVGEPQIEKMTLAQASRAIQVAARLARQALSDAPLPETTAPAPIQLEMAAALQKAFGAPAPAAAPSPETTTP